MKITFLGAAGEITGSQHLIETDTLRVLLDCGLFQGHRSEMRDKNQQFPCRPKDLSGVILSHAHADHCGNLPSLSKAGFRGNIFTTPATADLSEVMLTESAHLQQEDAKYLQRTRGPNHPVQKPIYDEDDVLAVIRSFQTIPYGEWQKLGNEFRIRFSDAGHILGSAITEMEIYEKGDWKRVVFTGDLGRRGIRLLRDPQRIPGCDVLITESTYGNRRHPKGDDMKLHLKRILKRAVERGSRVIIPAFSLGRTQTLVYFLNALHSSGELPDIPVFVDSPLSKEITTVYRHHVTAMDTEFLRSLKLDKDPFSFPSLKYIGSQQESMALNHRSGAFVVIAASGMCEAGRVVHHLKHALADSKNVVVLIGFQATNTLGRKLQDKWRTVTIFGKPVELNAEIESLQGLSAHADAEDFHWWFEGLAADRGVGRAFVVHGEPDSAQSLAQMLHEFSDEPAIVPHYGQCFEV
jgi:metallo-beta-lactamase family protein